MNIKDSAEIATDWKYVRKIFGIKYGLNTDDMTRSKGEDKVQAKTASDNKALSKT